MDGCKLFVFYFCALIFIVSCEEIINKTKPNHIKLKSRIKKASESDHLKKPKVTKPPLSIRSKPLYTRKQFPATKTLNLLPKNIIPKRNDVPVTNLRRKFSSENNGNNFKKPILTVDEKKINRVNDHYNDNTKFSDSLTHKDAMINDITSIEKSNLQVEATSLKKEDIEINKESIKNNDIPVDIAFVENDEVNDENIPAIPNINDEKEINNDIVTFVEEEFETIEDNVKESSVLCPIKVEHLADQCISKTKNSYIQSESERKEEGNDISSIVNETSTAPINKDTISKSPDISSEVSLRRDSLPALISPVNIPKIDIYAALAPVESKTKETGPETQTTKIVLDPVRFMPQQFHKIENKDNADISFPQHQSMGIIEPEEEIVVNQKNYEEIYESPAFSSNFNPSIISSDLRPTKSWNNVYNSVPFVLDQNRINYESRSPYTYDIKSYPNRYVINTYNNDNCKACDESALYQSYRNVQPLPTNAGQWGLKNRQGQNPLNSIWRSWNNNQIIVRPKTVSKNLSNDSGQSSGNIIDAGVNQNIVPYYFQRNPTQFPRSYGY